VNARQVPSITRPGACVAVDQAESPVPGLIAQLKGIPTKKCYKCAAVFVDLYSNLGYVYLQQSTAANETIKAKEAFERYAKSYGASIQHYHADNQRFAEAQWIKHCEENGQSLSYCGVNAHFQNGKAEKRIRDLQDSARTMLIHAHHRWPSVIDHHLWPYALRTANDVFNQIQPIPRQANHLSNSSAPLISPQMPEMFTLLDAQFMC